jgi:TMEM175 potassium channel family protein
MRTRSLMDVAGWEALLHGVFAIAITLLVLDIHVPPAESMQNGTALGHALEEQLPHYFAYVLGFMYLGTYWIATHRTLRMMRAVDHWFLILGLVYLMLVSAVPFATALLAEYIGKDGDRDKVALVVYTSWQLLLSIMANVTLRYASFRGRLLKPGIDPAALRSWERLALLGPVIWIAALLSALFLSGTITIVLMAVILLIFVQEAPGGSTEAAGETIAPAA